MWALILICALGTAKAQSGYADEVPSDRLVHERKQSFELLDDERRQDNGVFGEPGRDYPTFDRVPETGFSCDSQQFPGYYADPEARCQAFHVCHRGGHKDSFLCPVGTVFNQEYLVCVWWFDFDCGRAVQLYGVNEIVVKAMEEADSRLSQSSYDNNESSRRGNNGVAFVQAANGRDVTKSSNGVVEPHNLGNSAVPSTAAADRYREPPNINYNNNDLGTSDKITEAYIRTNGNRQKLNGHYETDPIVSQVNALAVPTKGTYLPPNRGSQNGFDNSIDDEGSEEDGSKEEPIEPFQPFNGDIDSLTQTESPSRAYLPSV